MRPLLLRVIPDSGVAVVAQGLEALGATTGFAAGLASAVRVEVELDVLPVPLLDAGAVPGAARSWAWTTVPSLRVYSRTWTGLLLELECFPVLAQANGVEAAARTASSTNAAILEWRKVMLGQLLTDTGVAV